MDLRPDHQFNPFGPEAAQYEGGDFDPNSVDWNDPSSFFAAMDRGGVGGLPVPKVLSPEEVRSEAGERRRNLFASYDTLHDILERHETMIQKRWLKKSRQQRQAILLEFWPSMPGSHRPDFEAFMKETPQQRDRGTQYRDSFMWPHVNQEDLLKPKTLLLLLNSRGRHSPHEFAAADGEVRHLGQVTGAIMPIFLNEHVMLLNGITERAEYGKLLAWDEHPDAFDWMHKRKQFLPGEGLLILQAQERLLGFLVRCCQKILFDFPADRLGTDDYAVQPMPQLKSEAEVDGFDSLLVMTTEAPYRPPMQLDLDRIISLLSARSSAAEDHLWSLREDPGYYAQDVMDAKDHRPRDGAWSQATSDSVVTAHLQLELFAQLNRQALQLRVLRDKYQLQISPKADLPKEYLRAILIFRHFLQQAAKNPLAWSRDGFKYSPPCQVNVRGRPKDTARDKVEDRLVWLLKTLWDDGQRLFLAGLPLVVDELERLLRSEAHANSMISGHVAGFIGDLSVIVACTTQLELYQPWANSFDSVFLDDYEKDIQGIYRTTTNSWAKVLDALKPAMLQSMKGKSGPAPSALGMPTDGRFTYPVQKRRNKENVHKMREAEANLDSFWEVVDEHVRQKVGTLEGTALQGLLSQGRRLQRTPEWVESVKAKPGEAAPSQTAEADVDGLSKPFSALFFGATSESAKLTAAARRERNKVKTKGVAAPAGGPDASPTGEKDINPPAGGGDLHDGPQPQPQPQLAVDARALKVFRTLFFNPATTSTPGEMPWRDFLHAMSATGFRAEKLYGSVWQFQPPPPPARLDDVGVVVVNRPIQFHEPHPLARVPFVMARRMGRRLNRAYGWVGDMFVLKEKAA